MRLFITDREINMPMGAHRIPTSAISSMSAVPHILTASYEKIYVDLGPNISPGFLQVISRKVCVRLMDASSITVNNLNSLTTLKPSVAAQARTSVFTKAPEEVDDTLKELFSDLIETAYIE